jgi:hypothetical protein
MVAALSEIAVAAAPYLLGLLVGFGVSVFAVQRWFHSLSAAPSGDLLSTLRRVGLQYLAAGIVVTLLAANRLGVFLTGVPGLEVTQHALWGLPFGLFFGARWMLRRGAR